MKRRREKEIFEFKLSNILLSMGIVMCTALSIISSLIFGRFIDFISDKHAFDQDTILYLIIVLSTLILTIIANVFFAKYFPLRLQLKKSIDYSQRVMNDLLKISQSNYQKREKGYYINLVTSSAFTCGDIYGQINVELVGNILCVLLMIAAAMYINIYFGIAYVIYIPLFALITQKPNKKIADFQKAGLPAQDSFLSGTKKIAEDKRVINIARVEDYYEELYKDHSEKYLSFVTKFKWYSILSGNIPKLLSVILSVSTMGIAAKLYFDSEMSIGTFFVVFQLSQLLQEPLNRSFEILIYRSINDAHIERIRDFNKQRYEKSGFEEIYGDISNLVSLSDCKVFSSADKKRMLFSAQKLEIPKKKLIIIKGGNGTGKSTLINLITGFTDINIFEGYIKLDSTLSKASYLSHPILFTNGNLKENMFGREIDKNVFEMLKITFQNKNISESGSELSLGEQQKVGLLRTLSSDSEVVILDEPFTNLDRESIESLTDFISKMKGKKSIIAVMHSHELDEFADMIIKISDQNIVCID